MKFLHSVLPRYMALFFPSIPSVSLSLCLSGFETKILYEFFISPILATCSAYTIIIYLISRKKLIEIISFNCSFAIIIIFFFYKFTTRHVATCYQCPVRLGAYFINHCHLSELQRIQTLFWVWISGATPAACLMKRSIYEDINTSCCLLHADFLSDLLFVP